MFLLDKDQYHKALQPLLKIKVNHLFARSVVEKHVDGIIYTDNPKTPSVFHVVHPYGMSLLYGETNDSNFHAAVADYMLNHGNQRKKVEWMQAWPGQWNSVIETLLQPVLVAPDEAGDERLVEVHTRANFKFDLSSYESVRKTLTSSVYTIVRTNRELYEKMEGTVVPKNFWNNAEDFIHKGIGYTLMANNEPACTAYSAYLFDKQLELGIETLPGHRRKGYAIHTCAALIDYCIEKGYEPVWSCRLQNTASYRLAQFMGFVPAITLPYYRLPL